MADIYCNRDECIYCFEGECQRTSIAIKQSTEIIHISVCASFEKSPGDVGASTKALKK